MADYVPIHPSRNPHIAPNERAARILAERGIRLDEQQQKFAADCELLMVIEDLITRISPNSLSLSDRELAEEGKDRLYKAIRNARLLARNNWLAMYG